MNIEQFWMWNVCDTQIIWKSWLKMSGLKFMDGNEIHIWVTRDFPHVAERRLFQSYIFLRFIFVCWKLIFVCLLFSYLCIEFYLYYFHMCAFKIHICVIQEYACIALWVSYLCIWKFHICCFMIFIFVHLKFIFVWPQIIHALARVGSLRVADYAASSCRPLLTYSS